MKNTLPKLAVWKFASCDGCQLSLLDCEDELLALSQKIHFAYFLEASSKKVPGPYDISLVEGSITTAADLLRIQEVRKQSRYLVTIGACATAGGIQALRNFRDTHELIQIVYAEPSYIDTLETSTPISDHVHVDFELRGCPVDKGQLLEVIKSFLLRKKPSIPNYSVCIECKRKGNVCILVTEDAPCLGPLTQAGCGALCPSYKRACYACFGPQETVQINSFHKKLTELALSEKEVERLLISFNADTFTAEQGHRGEEKK